MFQKELETFKIFIVLKIFYNGVLGFFENVTYFSKYMIFCSLQKTTNWKGFFSIARIVSRDVN